MSLMPAQIQLIQQALLQIAQPGNTAADQTVNRLLNQARCGVNDRKIISDHIFTLLRHIQKLLHLSQLSAEQLQHLDGCRTVVEHYLAAEPDQWHCPPHLQPLPPSVQAELPEWLFTHLLQYMPESAIIQMGQAMTQPAPLDLRANTLLSSRNKLVKQLNRLHLNATPTPYSPVGIRLSEKATLQQLDEFQHGALEIQDEGSQLLSYLLQPGQHQTVVDFCAGAGGKSLQLAAMMRNTGRIYALDIHEKRLNNLTARQKKARVNTIHRLLIQNEHDPRLQRLYKKADRVLVDAPCSGSGTLRRNPALKLSLTPGRIQQLTTLQSSILQSASQLVKPGGRLLYATCSLLPSENQRIVEAFLQQNPDFKALDASQIFRQRQIDLNISQQLILTPQQHQTDGFFAAVMERQ